MYEIYLTDSYRKKAIKFLRKHPKLKDRYKKTFLLMRIDPFNEVLQIKKLIGTKDLYRVRLTLHARIVIEIQISEKIIIPIDIATREDIY